MENNNLSNETLFVRVEELSKFLEICKKHAVKYNDRKYCPVELEYGGRIYFPMGSSKGGSSDYVCVMLRGSSSAIEKVKEEWGPEWNTFDNEGK